MAQLAARQTEDLKVASSILAEGISIYDLYRKHKNAISHIVRLRVSLALVLVCPSG